MRNRFRNTADLNGIADSERRQHAEHAEQHGHPLPSPAHTVLNIIHGAACPLPTCSALSVAYAQHNLCIFCSHAQKCHDPKPEQRARPAHCNCRDHSCNTACSDCSGHCRRKRLKRRDLTRSGCCAVKQPADRHTHNMPEAPELNAASTYRQAPAHSRHKKQHRHAPDDGIQPVARILPSPGAAAGKCQTGCGSCCRYPFFPTHSFQQTSPFLNAAHSCFCAKRTHICRFPASVLLTVSLLHDRFICNDTPERPPDPPGK